MTTDERPLVDIVEVERVERSTTLDPILASKILVDVVHDGDWIPEEFLVGAHGREIPLDRVWPDYVRERDWGAGAVAARLTESLGLGQYLSVNIARVLLDFARFPGSTPRNAEHLHRFAINYPFSQLLSYRQKKEVFENYYDEVSKVFEKSLAQRPIKISIHTYDQYNPSGTQRPAMSLMTRTVGYQTNSELPAGLFDPMYPDVLAEFTADRILHDRISLTLEKRHIPVAHNYPYLLPEGSLEVRHMVWSYFCTLRDAFEKTYPETVAQPSYAMVWAMLTDTNLRSSESESLRSYLHMYRRAPRGGELQFERAAEAYDHVREFCYRDPDVVDRYRYSPMRSSSIAIEVRKDIVCELGDDGAPVALRHDNINTVGDALAEAVETYFRVDRPDHLVPESGLQNPWLS